ncbi:type II and III secretion system protein family protein [Desulfovibrio inopinatus]|uniref:type II and III secretion system protein family protein n=1 Tax=Desulfovibrio inopinatus TaxID=102109 RepID=UPI0004152F86|nr:type II and III secretion system protein family protein [Desulfovibrio inopinatus]
MSIHTYSNQRPRPAWILVCTLLLFVSATPAHAQKAVHSIQNPPSLDISMGKSIILKSRKTLGRVSVAQPEIADFVLLSPTQVYVTGKAPGVTNLTLWDKNDRITQIFDLVVAPDVARLERIIQQALPEEDGVKVIATNDAIALSGTVRNSNNLTKLASLAEVYAPKKVINLLSVGGVQQVMLEVRVAEMQRNLLKRMKMNFNYFSEGDFLLSMLGGLTTPATEVFDIVSAVPNYFYAEDSSGNTLLPLQQYQAGQVTPNSINPSISAQSANAAFRVNTNYGNTNNGTWTGFIDILKENGLVKILAKPTLVCLSGETAKFLAGGEIPVPIPQGFGTISIEYKPFGVGLQFTPTVLTDSRISMKISPEVSELDYNNTITLNGNIIPGLNTRRASSVVEMNDGQTFALAGLIKETGRDAASRFPVLGDVPVLGMLFKSNEFQENETELVIVATVHLVQPGYKKDIKLPTDDFRTPNDLEFYLGIPTEEPTILAETLKTAGLGGKKAGMSGEFGHAVPTMPRNF